MSEPRNQIDYSGRGAVADVTVAFAGVMLVLTGGFDVLHGIAAIGEPDFYAAGSDYTFRFSVTAWGWIHLVLGILTIAVGVALLRGADWARVVGIVLAVLGALSNFLSIPAYPWWSMITIGIYVLVIWSITVQMRNYQR